MLNVKKVDYEKNPKFSLSKDLDNEEIILNSQNENRLVFDYLTFVSTQDTKEELISLLGLETLTFIQCKGFYGYSEQLFYEGIHIYFGGTSEMGVCVELSGRGCRNFEHFGTGNYEEVFSYILCNSGVNITRLDVAYDDFNRHLDFDKLIYDIRNENYVSRFREFELRSTFSKDPKKRGFSFYCGSSQSEIRFRIYDKRVEQQAFDQVESWIRFEIQLRRDRAAVFIDMFLSGKEMSTLFSGVVKNYLRFIIPSGDTNLSRCATAQYWVDFLGSVDKVSLFFPDLDYSESRLEAYVKSQCSGVCVTYISLFGFEAFVNMILSRSTLKLNPKYSFLLSKNQINDATAILKDGIEKFKDTPYEYNWLGGSLL